ncbi:MAG: tRNA adenosine(34) deaminase TadA [Gammaproteobacteria bacterium]
MDSNPVSGHKKNPETTDDLAWMRHAYNLALKAQQQGEVPVGAVLIKENKIIGEGWNRPIKNNDPTAHAEIMALRSAAEKIQNYRLVDTTLYVTLEPCVMCAGAIIHSRVKKVIYATSDPRAGAAGSVFSILNSAELNHKVDIENGLLQNESAELLRDFFKSRRRKTASKR